MKEKGRKMAAAELYVWDKSLCRRAASQSVSESVSQSVSHSVSQSVGQ
jgi:hypothetical protein